MLEKPTAPQVENDAAIVDDEAPSLNLENAGGDEPSISRPTLAASLRDNGFDIADDATDEDVISRMEELESAAEERERLRQENANLQAWLARQRQAEQKPTEPVVKKQPEPEKPAKPAPPEWNDSWEAYLEQDERGNVVVRKDYRGAVDPSLPEKYMARKRWERERLQNLLSNADSLFDESRFDSRLKEVEERAYQRAIEEFQKTQASEKQKSVLDQFAAESPWLFDANGAFTPIGHAFNERLTAHLQRGYSPADALRYAKFDTQEQTGQTPWVQVSGEGEAAVPTPAEKKLQLRRKKTNGVNRIAQTPVSRREGAAEDSGKASSIKQLSGNRWMQLLEQEAGAAE